jgi:hypothetical protein
MAAKIGRVCIDCGVRKVDPTVCIDSQMCGPCNEYAEAENMHSDFDHEGDNVDSDIATVSCPVCHPELDPRNVKVRTGHTNTVAKTRTSHAGHSHDVTPKARAACRKSLAAGHGPLQADNQ